MPHQRKRQVLSLLEKRLKLFPVVGVLGARQVGKSTLLREFLPQLRKIRYVTLDRDEIKNQAIQQPTLFLQNLESRDIKTICIDEVQKAPVLFDTIKAEVDEKKRPGRFALSGSTEFSKKTGVRESLTGRIALLRMFPLNLSEAAQCPGLFPLTNLMKKRGAHSAGASTLKEISQWLSCGGMPGIFSIRDESNRNSLFDAWVETTCTRDLGQFEIPRFNPDLARRILVATAQAEVPNRSEIAKIVGKDPRQVEAYLSAFKTLFVLYEVESHQSGVGKTLYYVFDSGIAHYLGSTEKRCLQIWFLNECFSQFSYSGSSRPDVFYYSSLKGSRVDFVVTTKKEAYGVLLTHEESPSTYTLRAAAAFRTKNPNIPVFVFVPGLHTRKEENNIFILPWNFAT